MMITIFKNFFCLGKGEEITGSN